MHGMVTLPSEKPIATAIDLLDLPGAKPVIAPLDRLPPRIDDDEVFSPEPGKVYRSFARDA